MSELHLVTLKQFSDRLQAEMAKGLLDNAHIPNILTRPDAGGARPAPFAFDSGSTLSVREEDLEKAQDVISVMEDK